MTDLFTPFDLHGLTLPNRILLSAMIRTRGRTVLRKGA